MRHLFKILAGIFVVIFAITWNQTDTGIQIEDNPSPSETRKAVETSRDTIQELVGCTLTSLQSFHPSQKNKTSFLVEFFDSLAENESVNTTNKIRIIVPEDFCGDLIPVYHEIYSKRQSAIKQNPNITNIHVQIIGGGTVGLIHALEAYESGASVSIVEKRTNYTRDIYFDLYGLPWFSSLEKMKIWGNNLQNLFAIIHNERVISVRAQLLERYLSRLLFYLGVEMYYGYSFVEILPGNDTGLALSRIRSDSGNEVLSPFNILVGADGSRSQVRSYSNIGFHPVATVDTGDYLVSLPSGLSQLALVLRLRPDDDGNCPREAIHPETGEKVLPWDISFQMPHRGIPVVYKRFFHNYCELQIFFNNTTGTLMSEFAQRGEYDWPFVLEIVNKCIFQPFKSVSSLLDSLKQRKSRKFMNGFEFDVDYVNVTIKQATSNVKYIPHNDVTKDTNSAVILVGDAAVTSHFRLGVGINAAFDQLEAFRKMLFNIAGERSFSVSVHEYELNCKAQQTTMAQFELLSILYEAYCDFLVFIDPDNEVLEGMMVFGKDYGTNDYNWTEFSFSEMLQSCKILRNLSNQKEVGQ